MRHDQIMGSKTSDAVAAELTIPAHCGKFRTRLFVVLRWMILQTMRTRRTTRVSRSLSVPFSVQWQLHNACILHAACPTHSATRDSCRAPAISNRSSTLRWHSRQEQPARGRTTRTGPSRNSLCMQRAHCLAWLLCTESMHRCIHRCLLSNIRTPMAVARGQKQTRCIASTETTSAVL